MVCLTCVTPNPENRISAFMKGNLSDEVDKFLRLGTNSTWGRTDAEPKVERKLVQLVPRL